MAIVDADETESGTWLTVRDGSLEVLGAFLEPDAAPGTPFTVMWHGAISGEDLMPLCRISKEMLDPGERGQLHLRGRAFAEGEVQAFSADAWLDAATVPGAGLLRFEIEARSTSILQEPEAIVVWARIGDSAESDGIENVGVKLKPARLPALEKVFESLISRTGLGFETEVVREALQSLADFISPDTAPKMMAA